MGSEILRNFVVIFIKQRCIYFPEKGKNIFLNGEERNRRNVILMYDVGKLQYWSADLGESSRWQGFSN